MQPEAPTHTPLSSYSRRRFLGGAISLPWLGQALTATAQDATAPAKPTRKIKTGFVGHGGRGSWIAGLFKNHGGYECWAVVDYFPQVAERAGNALGVDKSRRFSGLPGYQKDINGTKANAMVNYWSKAFLRGGPQQFGGGNVADLYTAGAKRNIDTFYQNVTDGHCDNPTIRRSVDGCLAAILGREAAARRMPLTMEALIKENKRLVVDTSSLKI